MLVGWIPLTKSTPSENVPKNCRVNVTFSRTTTAPSTETRGGTAVAESTGPRDTSAATVEGKERGWNQGAQILALPWRRFDQDLGAGGLEVSGTKLVVKDVPNSDEGTGLFTWVSSLEWDCPCVPSELCELYYYQL